MSDRKLVQALRVFFEKSVLPNVSQNEEIMQEWKHLSNIFNSNPIDFSQFDLYLLYQNKNFSGTPSSSEYSRSNPNQAEYGMKPKQEISKISNLISALQSFQSLMNRNQQKLQARYGREITQENMNVPIDPKMKRYQ